MHERYKWLLGPQIMDIHRARAIAVVRPLLVLLVLAAFVTLVASLLIDWAHSAGELRWLRLGRVPAVQYAMLVITPMFLALIVLLNRGKVLFVTWGIIGIVFALGVISLIFDATSGVYPLPFIISASLAGLTLGPATSISVGVVASLLIGAVHIAQVSETVALRRPIEHWGVIALQVFIILLISAMMSVANLALRRAFSTIDEDARVRRQLELDLFRAQKLEAIGRIAGGFAHDFGNLLGVVMTSAEILLAEGEISERARDSVGHILRSCRAGSSLTSQLLALGRKQVVQSKIFDPGLLIRDCAPILEHMVGRDASLELDCPPGLGRVNVDPLQLQQVLSNLVINAGQASGPNTTVRIELERTALEARLSGFPNDVEAGDYLRLAVQDQGTGMDERTLASAFEPFFTTKSAERGSGLGLAVVLGVVRQCGGQITIDTRLGEGTRFCLWFPSEERPASWEPAAMTAVSSFAGDVRLDGVRVLFVDDDEELRRLVSHVLRIAGAEVSDFGRGSEALAHVRRGGHPDVILSDVVMPEMSGPELVDRMREAGFGGPIVFISGYANPDEHREHLDRADGVLRKPVASQELVSCVHDCVSEGRA